VADEIATGFTVSVTLTIFDVVPVAATVIVALYVPAFKPAVLTLAVTVPLPEPEAGVTDSQDALSVAVGVPIVLCPPVGIFEEM
jgi:hypothetical protein